MRESRDRHEIMERTSDAGAAKRVRKNKNAMIDREDTKGAGRDGPPKMYTVSSCMAIVLWTGLESISSEAGISPASTVVMLSALPSLFRC